MDPALPALRRTRVVQERCYLSRMSHGVRKDNRQRHFSDRPQRKRDCLRQAATPAHSVQFMRGMVRVARSSKPTQGRCLGRILKDLSNYSYAYLRLHAKVHVSSSATCAICSAGLARTPLFWDTRGAALAADTYSTRDPHAKGALRSTPRFGGLYAGEGIDHLINRSRCGTCRTLAAKAPPSSVHRCTQLLVESRLSKVAQVGQLPAVMHSDSGGTSARARLGSPS